MNPQFEIPGGSVNGTNRNFTTSVDYRPGTLQVWHNGLLLRKDITDGWVETGSNSFRMHIAPRVDDKLQVFFISVL